MSKITIKLNRAGVRELLRSHEMGELLTERAAEIADRCGAGYAHDRKLTPSRVVASVFTDDDAAKKENAEQNTILRSLQ